MKLNDFCLHNPTLSEKITYLDVVYHKSEKSKRLLEVKKLIEETENEWLLVNEEIDNIKAML